MRLVIRLLGTEVFAVETGPEAVVEEDDGAAMNGGTTYSTPMGFVSRMDKPDEADFPDRVAWD